MLPIASILALPFETRVPSPREVSPPSPPRVTTRSMRIFIPETSGMAAKAVVMTTDRMITHQIASTANM
ncbi:hypothetical protein AA103581_2473 [Gluconobacter wancherniae NBRC 103581]|nr:hypothetical protein AA103581_2473 [Gluconobacter wancherniae NBRC 103581]